MFVSRATLMDGLFLLVLTLFTAQDPYESDAPPFKCDVDVPAPVDPDPNKPLVIFPTNQPPAPAPLPVPPVDPRTVTTLTANELYVVESQIELMLRTFGDGAVKIFETPGPKVIPAKFAGGGGVFEVREFTYPFLYILTAAKSGTVATDFIPSGLEKKNEAKITRQILTITTAPQPPPKPEPKPDPKPQPVPPTPEPEPTPPAPVTYEYVRLVIVEDSLNRSPETALTMNGLVTWAKFLDGGHEYRIYDKSTKEKKGKQAIEDTGVIPYPAYVLYDRQTGSAITTGALPPTFSELKAIINLHLAKPVAKNDRLDKLSGSLDRAAKSADRLKELLVK